MILADTCVWIGHFRSANDQLSELLGRRQVLMHECVLGELACGSLPDRAQTLTLFSSIPQLPSVNFDELMYFIDAQLLHGTGLNFVDIHLLAASKLHPNVVLWTCDHRLQQEADRLAVKRLMH